MIWVLDSDWDAADVFGALGPCLGYDRKRRLAFAGRIPGFLPGGGVSEQESLRRR